MLFTVKYLEQCLAESVSVQCLSLSLTLTHTHTMAYAYEFSQNTQEIVKFPLGRLIFHFIPFPQCFNFFLCDILLVFSKWEWKQQTCP